jgi:hypothetical protein
MFTSCLAEDLMKELEKSNERRYVLGRIKR